MESWVEDGRVVVVPPPPLPSSAPAAPPGPRSGIPRLPPPGYAPRPQFAPGERPPLSGFAVASLVLGLLFVFWVGAVLAVVFARIARTRIRASQGAQRGTGMALAGEVLGWCWLVLLGLALLVEAFNT